VTTWFHESHPRKPLVLGETLTMFGVYTSTPLVMQTIVPAAFMGPANVGMTKAQRELTSTVLKYTSALGTWRLPSPAVA
jgi:hypothetical protein